MMERTIILPDRFDLSEIAEALIYYSHVEILINHGNICDLIGLIGIDNTIRLSESDIITFIYERTHSVICSNENEYLPYSIASASLSEDKNGRRVKSVFDELDIFIKQKFGRGIISIDKVRRLANSIHERNIPSTQIHAASLTDIADNKFLNNVIRIVMAQTVPTYPNISHITCHSIVENGSFHISGNIDFQLANSLYPIKGPNNLNFLNYQTLISPILKMRSEMYHSGDRNCDIFTSDLQSKVFTYRVNSFLDRVENPSKNINRFEEYKFRGRSFRRALSSGDVSIIDVLEFAESQENRRFKYWLNSLKANSDILSEYEVALRESPITSKLPYKVSKFAFMSVLGFILNPLSTLLVSNPLFSAILSDIAVESLDGLLLSKIHAGWKPNQWVFKSANEFFSSNNSSSA
jgi:hypothetical protein